ncbi:MAG: hypothetical protein AAF581_12255 [Planctomycetota bacterium]
MKKFFALLGLLLATSTVSAQQDDRYILNIGSASQATGTTVDLSVTLDSVTGTLGAPVNLQGWSYGVCSDSLVADVTNVVDGALSATVNNGLPPAFNSINFDPWMNANPPVPAGPGNGFAVGVVVDLFGMFTLAPGTAYELNVATYNIVGAAGDSTSLDFCDTLANPPVETLMVEMGGASAIPVQNSGLIDIPVVVGPMLTLNASDETGNVGSQVSVSVTLDHAGEDVEGFSFGLTHDSGIATLNSIGEGAASLATNTAGGAAFFHSDSAPTLPAGVNGGGFVGAVISLAPPFDVIPAAMGSELATFTYDVILDGTTPVEFSGAVGDPAVAIIVSVNGGSQAPLNVAGSITGIAVVGDLFIRGDANDDGAVDVSDVVYLAKALFGVGPALACDNAGDTNDNDMLDAIEDPMFLLMYLFQGGVAPAAPFPTCDLDGTPGTLACAASLCP